MEKKLQQKLSQIAVIRHAHMSRTAATETTAEAATEAEAESSSSNNKCSTNGVLANEGDLWIQVMIERGTGGQSVIVNASTM